MFTLLPGKGGGDGWRPIRKCSTRTMWVPVVWGGVVMMLGCVGCFIVTLQSPLNPALVDRQVRKEAALKCLLSALWNLSSHCSVNKAEICGVPGALRFLVSVLARGSGCVGKPGVKAYAVVENGGGVLRNVSSHVAGCEACRMTLRENVRPVVVSVV